MKEFLGRRQFLSEEQLQAQVDWLNTWEQLKDTAIPMRFYEQFSKNLQLDGLEENISLWNKIKKGFGRDVI